ncbi:MAG: metal-dependent phosphohydrolase [Desulfobulbus propionicus]|nr:MAG: metal-dependent phosphohydrolase [Desulfobulbus propionicus]
MNDMELIGSWLTGIWWNSGFFGLALVLVIIIFLLFRVSKKEEQAVPEIRLQDLSRLWTREGRRNIHISELSPLWREEEPQVRNIEEYSPDNPRAAAFMEKIRTWAWFNKFPQQQAVCKQILMLLDKEGLCPSIVDINGDVEGGWDENTFQLLAKTSLLDNSLNVAEQVVQLLSENKAWHVIPDTMVAALAHDLGKLESIRGYLYSLGEHPLAAGRPLAAIPGFKELSKKEEILQAIKLHHKLPRGLLGKTLKKADQLARQKELEETVLNKGAEDLDRADSHLPEKAQTNKKTSARQAQEDIFNATGQPEAKHVTPESLQQIDISSWFDPAQFLAELKPYINKMFGRRFMAFSMPDGHVYFQIKVLEEVARKMAEKAGCMEIITMADRDESMRRVLLTIVSCYRAEHEIIARGLIKDNFFGGYFSVTRKIGKSIKGYYTPFHAEAFGSIAEMEQNKPQMLRDIVKVSPYLDDMSQEQDK